MNRNTTAAEQSVPARNTGTRDPTRLPKGGTVNPVVPPPGSAPEALHRRIIETTHEGVWLAGFDGITTFMNPQMARMLKTTPEQALGRSVFDFVFPDDHASVRSHFAEFRRSLAGLEVEERLRCADGSEIWTLVAANLFAGDDQTPAGYLGMFTNITDRKKVAAQLQENQARLALQIRRMPIAHIVWNTEFLVESWNPAAEQIFGYTASEALGKHPFALIVPRPAQAQVADIWKRLLLGDATAHSVNENLTRDGRRLVCEWSNTPLRDERGRVIGVLSMAQDITERQRAGELMRHGMELLEQRVQERTAELMTSHRALVESEARHRRLFETISDAVLIYDPETRRFPQVNEAALRLYGYTRDEFSQLTMSDVSAEPEKSESSVAMCLAGATPKIPMRYHRKKDGTVFPAEISSSSLNAGGRLMACGIIRDITNRVKAEEALQKREDELADFFAESPLGLLWVAPDGRILRVNQAELELLGRSSDEVFGKQVGAAHGNPGMASELLERLARHETVRNFRTRAVHGDGSALHLLIDANGLWSDSTLVHSRWFIRDITHSVELENEILAATEREQQRLGRDLHDDLCQQLAGISFLLHRLTSRVKKRTPVHREAKEVTRMLQHALVQTRELARGLSPVTLESGGLVDSLAELASRTGKVYGVDCRFDFTSQALLAGPEVSVHLYRIAQEAVNNALKHGAARTISIRLGTTSRNLVLSVVDDGKGFDGSPETTGMGLRTMKYRAEVAGGSLSVTSKAGHGTEVVCQIPCVETAMAERHGP